MWRPQEVVPEYRRRAVLVWALLIAAILLYSVLLVYQGVEKRKTPNSSIVIAQNEVYEYPDLWVCLYDTYGCDDYNYEDQCVMSINDTEGGITTARYRPGDEDEISISFTAGITEKRGWCVVFETSAVDYYLGVDQDVDDYIDYTHVDMSWYPGGSANNSTTCIQETGKWTSHKENIYAFLNDPVSGGVSAGIQIPYSCMTNESTSHSFTYVGIGVTKELKLNGDELAAYSALTLSTVEWKDEATANITGIQAPYARISLQLQQESNSMTVITEIDPLDTFEILGQVGGFWDLILIFWPILFVAASYDPPHLKPRNFRKSAETVKRALTEVFPSSLRGLTGSKAEMKSRRQLDAKDGELSTRENEAASSRHQEHHQEDTVLIRLLEDHGVVAVVDTPSRVAKFLQTEFGAKYLKRGATEPALKNLLPPKTHLVMIPTNTTGESIAKTVARYCKAGGYAGQANSAGSFTVKVKRVYCSALQSQILTSSYVRKTGFVHESDVELGEDESDVELGEEYVMHALKPAHSGVDSRQKKSRRISQGYSASFLWPRIPREISRPARRPLTVHSVCVSEDNASTAGF